MATYLLHLGASIVPLGAYFLYLAWMNGRSHPAVSTGVRDVVMLTIGLAGLVVLGPVGAAFAFTGAWWSDAALIVLMLALVVLTLSGEWRVVVVYNVGKESMWCALVRAVDRLGWEHQVHEGWVDLPDRAAALEVRYFRAMRNATIRVRDRSRSRAGVHELHAALRCELAGAPSPGRFAGRCFLMIGVVLFAWPFYVWITEIAQLGFHLSDHLRP